MKKLHDWNYVLKGVVVAVCWDCGLQEIAGDFGDPQDSYFREVTDGPLLASDPGCAAQEFAETTGLCECLHSP